MRNTIRAALFAALALAALNGCAYYNTFYLAKRYYYRATNGAPYSIQGNSTTGVQNYNKSIDYSKKLLANHPKSKWVDDAYLMWARGLLGRDDPLQTVTMLKDFTAKYPESPIASEATFFLGVAHRSARQYTEAIAAFETFLEHSPKHDLAPYALYERARSLRALKRPGEAADALSLMLDRFPKTELADHARTLRAEVRFEAGQNEQAREEFRAMGLRSRTDDERFDLLLREADAIEAARRYDEALALLNDALSHEHAPVHTDTTGGRLYTAPIGPGADRFGRLTLRIGTVHLLAGRMNEALVGYRRVIDDYPRTALAAEAQYRIGYAYETEADDFARAREAYARVREHGGSQSYIQQAAQRLSTLDQIEKFRSSSGDSLQRRAETNFMLAEQYLFQLDKPERALEQYSNVADSLKGTPWAAKALTAKAWVLSRKLSRQAEADSLLWIVVREYPETEAQLAARDYLELSGHTVPAELIQPPKPAARPMADTLLLTPAPLTPPLGTPGIGRFGIPDSTGAPPRGVGSPIFGRVPNDSGRFMPPRPMPGDTLRPPVFPGDTLRPPGAPRDTTPAPPDTSRRSP